MKGACSKCRQYRSPLDLVDGVCVQCRGLKSRHLGDWDIVAAADSMPEILKATDGDCGNGAGVPDRSDRGWWINEHYLPDPPPAKKERANARRHNPKHLVRRQTTAAVRNGEIPSITEMSCAVCGGQAKEYHHQSYDKPDSYLDVVALCVECHNNVHLNLGGNANFFIRVRSRGLVQK